MQQSWEIRGVYATWRMTIVADPPDDAEETDLRCWSEKNLDNLVGHFQDSATLWDMYEEDERATAKRIL